MTTETSSPGWELYRTFLGVLQAGSLSAAARELGLTQPTVGRHVAALEQSLELTLFTRSQTGLLPTDAARALEPHVRSMAATAAAMQREARSQADSRDRVQGTVRITASEIMSVEVLPPLLAALREREPGLVIELLVSNRLQDLLHREADIAVRMTPPTHGALVARRIGDIELGLHAHRDYLARRGTPKGEDDLMKHDLIGFDTETPFIREMARRIGGITRESFALRTDNDLAQLAALRAGHGIGFCQVAIARRDDRLVRLMPRRFSVPLPTWVAMHEDLRASPRCQVTFQALAEGLEAYVRGRG